MAYRTRVSPLRGLRIFLILPIFLSALLHAAQIDIHGPSGSGQFGYNVLALPNGNFIVTDPQYSTLSATHVGAVYLYAPNGSLISALTGSSANDQVGNGSALVVGNNNALVVSPQWNGGAGAATWINGTSGLNGTVSAANSLVGSTATDNVGSFGMTLSNGNYLVFSPNWASGANTKAGAVTWGNGNSGTTGPVSLANSLVGATANDQVGYFGAVALGNGNYVVRSPQWSNGVTAAVGAATWGNGASGTVGAVSAANSLVGSTNNDRVGFYVFALANGNYVASSQYWNNAGLGNAGAVTWGNGASGTPTGTVDSTNSLVGTTANDFVGYSGVTVLVNGNYVVKSPQWHNGAVAGAGAATWCSGSGGITGPISVTNSLVGSTTNDNVGGAVTALGNGNYVVGSSQWSNGSAAQAGAATLGDGAAGIVGAVSITNSLVGSTTNDNVGERVYALGNGDFVVTSPRWSNAGTAQAGAVTWGDGVAGIVAAVSPANSLVGTNLGDLVGTDGIAALPNGGYVVASAFWNGSGIQRGAASWSPGGSPITGTISATNSLIGSNDYDRVSEYGVPVALVNGDYVVSSWDWANGGAMSAGAVTWARGNTGLAGTVSLQNSLTGTQGNDQVGYGEVRSLSDGNYLIYSPYWSNGTASSAGAVTLASGQFRVKGAIASWNSVLGATASGGLSMSYDYDATHHQLIVGRVVENLVSLFTMDQIFADDLDP